MSPTPDYWFRAKRYGWGWGLPTRWQGWVVLLVYFALIGATIRFAPPDQHLAVFFSLIALFSVALVAVCWLKGEPPRWRWGKD
ncbi:hypothetical protein LMG28688_00424 [Paraburkholderia caffeinitolerans]|uniref:Uncharacterized protein n=1 Tax=Paraburkholderia caffeinitolerans TaxID=1723730 RepID=A0A6J5FDA6_9BURK|nr:MULTISPECIES: hypothetical protein [Paraburkholderia]CAB3777739.1 hypothetical protein LMG28688_00424 [Paraburkholderia caffeinitolerans]